MAGGIGERLGSKKTVGTMVCCLVCFTAVSALIALQPPMIRRLDMMVYDVFLRGLTGGEPSPVPIMIDIDERSISELGQWPWPRYRLAELVAALYEGGVASVGVDILMSEPDRTSPLLWSRQIKEDFGIETDIAGLPPELMDNDKYLASVLAQIPVVLSAYGTLNPADSADVRPRVINVTKFFDPGVSLSLSISDYVPNYDGIQMPVGELARNAAYIGLMNAEGDEDGIFRRVPLFSSYDGIDIPGLALATLALGAGDGSVVVRLAADGPRSLRVAGVEVPISKGGTLPIAFRGASGSYPRYSAVDVIRGDVSPEDLAGRVAFLGSTSAGLLDLRATPFEKSYPGLEIHAAVVDTILSGRFITEPESRVGLELIVMALTGVMASVFFSVVRPHVALPLGGLLGASVWAGARYMMVAKGIYLTPLYSLVNMALQALSSSAVRFWFEEGEKKVLRKAFSNYVSPEIVGQIVKEGSVSSLRGEQRNISVLFTDLRGFTSIVEKMAPTQVVGMLGSYFAPMTSIVRGSMGTLDKFVGDALMAFWNAPLDVPDHPVKAVESLLEMHRALGELNLNMERDYGIRLRMGGGIHTGLAHVGNMGTSELMDYTAIGDTVNTASRLEGMCPKYGVGAVISKDTADLCAGRFMLMPLDIVRVKGRSAGIPIFSVLPQDEATAREEELQIWDDAFKLYVAGDFESSLEKCRLLLRKRPDEKLYQIFAERARAMGEVVPEDWDGVYTYENK
ncbi:MAG: adenylate/guanylate cyclase domain-containing protein [Synergistaceae bacterium]|nr:adenylate/guanylate cyclase domain-containing protein [Synergistaceae bacterium]